MPTTLEYIINSAMEQDLSWKNSTEKYINLYQTLN